MRKVNLNEIAEDERKSPKGKFHKFVKDISIALGRDKDSLDLAKRHPFDLALVRIPKGKATARITGIARSRSSTSSSRGGAKCAITKARRR